MNNDHQNVITTNNQTKKVVLIHDKFPPHYAGGGEYVVLMVAQHLLAQGIDVKVITTGLPQEDTFEHIPIQRLACSSYQFNFRWKDIAHYAREADIIQAFTYHSIYPSYKAAQKLNIPVVVTVLAQFGNHWINMKGTILGRVFAFLEKKVLGIPVNAKVYLSDFSFELAKQITPEQRNSVVIEPGISLQDYSAAKSKNYVLFAGKFEGRKGVDKIISAAIRLPNIPFRLIGWGDFNKYNKQDMPDNVQLIEFVDRLHLAKNLAKAKIFVFPTQIETFGLVLAEAMASGCAIVSSSRLNFEGIKIPWNDVDAMCQGIEELWRDPKRCQVLGEANQKLAHKYHWPTHVKKLVKLYDSLI